MVEDTVIPAKQITCVTTSDEETISLGQRLGALLLEGDVVALVGELGSGKTWFTKGLALGLGVSPDTIVTSPSFTLVNEYKGRYTFYHMDFYRLEKLPEVLSAGLEEYLHDSGVVALEWADRWPDILPEKRVTVKFLIIDECRREITFSAHHERAAEILGGFEQGLRASK
ncbi:MAG: tRNA (adenosine(37)-N6)-threonylcarbamoyltransferase complex ATPase subunit type 1 TsaE [Desulfobacteraceae bacterium]|jgi:tRNA threonylcarbamoyladenosine biosynthesis protein TsaE